MRSLAVLVNLVKRVDGENDYDYLRKVQFASKYCSGMDRSSSSQAITERINVEFAIQELGFSSDSHKNRLSDSHENKLNKWLEIKKSHENSKFCPEIFKKYRAYVQSVIALNDNDCDKIELLVFCLKYHQPVMTFSDIVGICNFLKSEDHLQKVNADVIQKAINELRIEDPALTQAASLLKSVIEQWNGSLLQIKK